MSGYAQQTAEAFAQARACYEETEQWLASAGAAVLTHAELEDRLRARGRELLRRMFQGQLELRALCEERRDEVTGVDGIRRTRAEKGHARPLATVFGQVTVTRMAYRAPGAPNVHPADAELNLPEEKQSHGLRKLAAIESARGSHEDAAVAVTRGTGVRIGKRQVEELARRAAADIGAFYAGRRPGPAADDVVLGLQFDGKGVVMRPEALRPATAKAAAAGGNKLATRLSPGGKRGRKRMAELAAVYDCKPAPRTPGDIITQPGKDKKERNRGPKATGKWLTASVTDDIPAVITGDFVHVLEYLWKAAWSFFETGDPGAEEWVADQAIKILEGKARQVAAGIRRRATTYGYQGKEREGADTCAGYLTAKAPYLDYATALAKGWPIATGVIEGACRHLVADRMGITGARWGLDGAQAILWLRAINASGDTGAYWDWHITQEHQRNHLSRYQPGFDLAA